MNHDPKPRLEVSDKTHSLVLSFMSIRRAIGVIGILLPVLLGPVGWLMFSIEFQENMSSYYHTELRDVFVGSLCSIGIFLFCYRGYDRIENWTANIGCVSALGVALFPLDANSDPLFQKSLTGYIHTLSGGVFFSTLAFYSLFHFPNSNKSAYEIAPHEAERNFVYRMSGIVILVSMVAMGCYLFLLSKQHKTFLNYYHFLFWAEWVAVWAFASAWLTKGRAILADIAVDLISLPGSILSHRKH